MKGITLIFKKIFEYPKHPSSILRIIKIIRFIILCRFSYRDKKFTLN